RAAAAGAVDALSVRRGHGPDVAGHGAADQWRAVGGVRAALPRHPVRPGVHRPPAGLVPGRVDGRARVRGDRFLRPGVAAGHRPGRARRRPALADRRPPAAPLPRAGRRMSRLRAAVALLAAAVACVLLFAAWLHPRVVSAWLGAWTTALCG